MDTSIFWTILCGVVSVTVAIGSILLTWNRLQSSESTTAEPAINPFESPTVPDTADTDAIASNRTPSKPIAGFIVPLSIVLSGFTLGVITRFVRPYADYQGTHLEALAALLILLAASLVLAFHNFRIARLQGHLRFQLENIALWGAFVCGWTLVHGYFWGDLVSVMGVWALACGFLGSLLLAIIHWFRRPTAAQSSA